LIRAIDNQELPAQGPGTAEPDRFHCGRESESRAEAQTSAGAAGCGAATAGHEDSGLAFDFEGEDAVLVDYRDYH